MRIIFRNEDKELTVRLIEDNYLKRRDGESEFDFHKRILEAKLVDKTLDLDFSTLSPYLYGQSYSSDVARRMAYGSLRTILLMSDDDYKNSDDRHMSGQVVDEVDNKIAELRKERQRFFDQRREYNKLLAKDGRLEHLYDTLKDAASALSESVGVMYDAKPVNAVNRYDKNNCGAVLVLGDWHYGMTTDNIFNKYNTDVCKRRVKHVVEQAIDRIQLHGCTTLDVVVLGDLFHGAIHTSARVASEELVCDQIMQVSEILAQSIQLLSKYVNRLTLHCTYGNHGRTVQNKKDNIHSDNMERLIPWWLKERLSTCPNVEVDTTEYMEFIFFESYGHGICATHGDIDNVKSSPRLITSLFHKAFGKDVEYIILGDKHHRETFEELGVTSAICGSLCGTDDYANDHRLYSTPSQLLLIVDEESGVDAEYQLKCNDK